MINSLANADEQDPWRVVGVLIKRQGENSNYVLEMVLVSRKYMFNILLLYSPCGRNLFPVGFANVYLRA